MLITTVLLVLFADQILWNLDATRRQLWNGEYALKWVPLASVRKLMASNYGVATVLITKLTTVYLLTLLFSSLGWPLELLFSAAVLLITLGPVNLDRQIEDYLGLTDPETRSAAFKGITGRHLKGMNQDQLNGRLMAQSILKLALPRLFGTLFWFLLLGPAGAVGFQLLYWLPKILDRLECKEESPRQQIRMLRHYADWVPTRLLVLSYGVAGNFERVAYAWKHYMPESSQSDSEALLVATGTAALDSYQQDKDLKQEPSTMVIEDALSLVWRTLSIWILLIAVVSLVFWLA